MTHPIPSLPSPPCSPPAGRLPAESDAQVFNLDKCGYASDLTSIEALITVHETGVIPVDVVIGEECDQSNNTANDGSQQGFAVEPKPTPICLQQLVVRGPRFVESDKLFFYLFKSNLDLILQ